MNPPWVPDENKVCWGGLLPICNDAGSPEAARATIDASYPPTPMVNVSATQTAMPVITNYGDITIQRFYDPVTGRFIYVCSNRQTSQPIPCSIQEER